MTKQTKISYKESYEGRVFATNNFGDIEPIKISRKVKANRGKEEYSSQRLAVRCEIQEINFKLLKRSFEC